MSLFCFFLLELNSTKFYFDYCDSSSKIFFGTSICFLRHFLFLFIIVSTIIVLSDSTIDLYYFNIKFECLCCFLFLKSHIFSKFSYLLSFIFKSS